MQNINSEVIYYSRSTTTKGGTKITLQVPDEEIGQALDAIGAGKRYLMALVPLTDDDQPDAVPERAKRHWSYMKLSQQAGILCQDERFWDFIDTDDAQKVTENNLSGADIAAAVVRMKCGVNSRAELDTNPEAAERFERIKTDFDVYTGRIAAP